MLFQAITCFHLDMFAKIVVLPSLEQKVWLNLALSLKCKRSWTTSESKGWQMTRLDCIQNYKMVGWKRYEPYWIKHHNNNKQSDIKATLSYYLITVFLIFFFVTSNRGPEMRPDYIFFVIFMKMVFKWNE